MSWDRVRNSWFHSVDHAGSELGLWRLHYVPTDRSVKKTPIFWKLPYESTYIGLLHVISLLLLLGCHFFVLLWFHLNFQLSSQGMSLLKITMATLRKMHLAGTRLCCRYPCESSDDLWAFGLIWELREGQSWWLSAESTGPIKNASYVDWGTLDIARRCTALASSIFIAYCWHFP